MVCLVVEAPLTYDQVGTRVLHHLDHVPELFLFVIPQFIELFHTRNIQFVLRFWAGRLERAGEDREAGVFDGRGHLWVRHVLVDEHALDEGGVSERAANFSINLDEVKGNVATVDICHRQHCLYGDLCKLPDLFRDAVATGSAEDGARGRRVHFAAEARHSGSDEIFLVLGREPDAI